MTNKEFYKRALKGIQETIKRTDISEEKKQQLGLYTAAKSYKEQLKKIEAGQEKEVEI